MKRTREIGEIVLQSLRFQRLGAKSKVKQFLTKINFDLKKKVK